MLDKIKSLGTGLIAVIAVAVPVFLLIIGIALIATADLPPEASESFDASLGYALGYAFAATINSALALLGLWFVGDRFRELWRDLPESDRTIFRWFFGGIVAYCVLMLGGAWAIATGGLSGVMAVLGVSLFAQGRSKESKARKIIGASLALLGVVCFALLRI